MQHNSHSDSNDGSQGFNPEEQSVGDLIARGVEAAAKGENIEQVLEVMLTYIPASAKEKTRKQFAAALVKRGLRQPSGDADIPSRQALSRIRAALTLSTRQMIERVMQLVRARPDIAAQLQQAGKTLLKNGVMANSVTSMSEGDLGTIAPSAATGKAQADRASGRGV